MLKRLMAEIEAADGAIDLRDLERRLGVEQSALDGMIGFLMQKGRLEISIGGLESTAKASCDDCGTICSDPTDCPFLAKAPRVYTVPRRDSP